MARWLFATIAVLATLIAGPAYATEDITIQLRWKHQFQFAGYYLAVDRGYYKDLGYEVTLRESDGDVDSIAEVVEGRAEYGVGSSDLVVAKAHGKEVVVLAPIFQHSPLVLVALRSSNIESVHDLAGKRVALEHGAADLIAYLTGEGLPPSSYTALPHAQNVSALLNHEVDAMSAYLTDEPFELLEAHEEVRIFTPRASGIDFYGDTLFTSEEETRLHKPRVEAIRSATLMGWRDAMSDHHAAIEAVLRRSQRHSRAHLEFEAEHSAPLIAHDIVEFGYNNPARWRHIADTYESLELVPRGVSLDGFLYRQSLPLPAWIWWLLLSATGISLAVGAGWWRARGLARELALARIREAQTATERMEGQQRLVAMLSHEFRNPLAGIDRAANLLALQGESSPEQGRRLLGIRTQVQRLTVLVDSILLSEPSGHAPREVRREEVSVQGLLDGLRQNLVDEMAERVVIRVEPEQLTLNVDPRLLALALSNVLDNALRYSPMETAVDVVAEERGSSVRLSIRDRGPGVPEGQIAELGAPYHQSGRRSGKQGTGLGYYFCKRIVEQHGGTMTATNHETGGLLVTLELSASDPRESPSDGQVSPLPIEDAPATS